MRALLSLPSGGEAVVSGRSNTNTTISNVNNSNVIASLIPPANMLANQIAYVFAKVRISTSGVVALSWAQNTTDAVNVVTVKSGSKLVYKKV